MGPLPANLGLYEAASSSVDPGVDCQNEERFLPQLTQQTLVVGGRLFCQHPFRGRGWWEWWWLDHQASGETVQPGSGRDGNEQGTRGSGLSVTF